MLIVSRMLNVILVSFILQKLYIDNYIFHVQYEKCLEDFFIISSNETYIFVTLEMLLFFVKPFIDLSRQK
jgi:hypothetical protein